MTIPAASVFHDKTKLAHTYLMKEVWFVPTQPIGELSDACHNIRHVKKQLEHENKLRHVSASGFILKAYEIEFIHLSKT